MTNWDAERPLAEGAVFRCPPSWLLRLPSALLAAEDVWDLAGRVWPLLVLTLSGCRRLQEAGCRPRCRILLSPGDAPPVAEAETIVTYGLSPRDSLTLSSLTEPVLCVQRALPRPDGGRVEPREIPLPPLPGPAEGFLPLFGSILLQMPLERDSIPW